jgi:polar amino acid transport system permease protein
VLFYLPYPLLGLRLPGFVLAIAAFGLYAGVYLSESMRAGLRSVDPQLRAAGQVLGLTKPQILIMIELPLVYRTMLPDVINVAVTVFKDTSTLAIVAVAELTYTGRQMLMSESLNYGLVLVVILFSYWAPATVLSAWALRAERRRMRLEHVRIRES